jgi:hypothetical protein
MNVILFYDLFVHYLKLKFLSNLKNDDLDLMCYDLIVNNRNKYVLSENYVDLIANYIRNNEPDLNSFVECFTELISHGDHISVASSNTTSLQYEFVNLVENNECNVYLAFCENPYDEFQSIKDKINITSRCYKPNKEWIAINLASKGTCTVRNTDFFNNSDITAMFSYLYSIPNSISIVYIFDNYLNIKKHALFDHFKPETITVKYYSTQFEKNHLPISENDLNKRKAKLKKSLGSSTEYFVGDMDVTHHRTIIYDNFIIECNHDFAQLKRNRTWRIDISFDSSIVFNFLQICGQFNPK